MTVTVTISADGEVSIVNDVANPEKRIAINSVEEKVDSLIAQQGDDIGEFPHARIGGYMSHFLISFEMYDGPFKGQLISITSPMAAQSVTWADPFIYQGSAENHEVNVPLPKGSDLSSTIKESDFFTKPDGYFESGKETIWLQILNLDARMDSEIGPIRIILGETLKREYPDIFRPSLGAAQSLGNNGFPARLFFNPYAVIETPIGAFRAIHGTLAYGRVTSFPPIGTPVSICDCIPIEPVDEVIKAFKAGKPDADIKPIGRIIALSHPIDMEMQMPGEEAYELCEKCISHDKGD